MAAYDDYKIPEGYCGILYAGDVFFYTDSPDEYTDIASGISLGEYETTEWYENLDECIESVSNFDRDRLFDYPYHGYVYARVIVDGIELDGTETPGETGWNYNRLAWPAYVGERIENSDYGQ